MSGVTVDQQILDALAVLLSPAATGATSVHVERDDSAEPYEPAELPAINLLAVEEAVSTPSSFGMAYQPVLQVRTLALVVQILYRGTDSARKAREIGATVEQLIGADPLLGGKCTQGMKPDGRQWVRDDAAERPLTRQNTRFVCAYSVMSNDPTTPI